MAFQFGAHQVALIIQADRDGAHLGAILQQLLPREGQARRRKSRGP
jgi:hypothetical protein